MNPYISYLLVGFFILTFGPYVLEYYQEKMDKKNGTQNLGGKIIVEGITDKDGKKIISIKRKSD